VRLSTIAGWLLFVGLAVLALVARPEVEVAETPERVLSYPLGDEPIRFSLEPDDREVKILTWLSVPRASHFDPRATWTYRLEARVHDALGAIAWSQDIFVRARQSRLLDASGILSSIAFRVDRPGFVTDSMQTELVLPANLPERAVLALGARATSPGGEVMGVAFRRGTRGQLEQVRVHFGAAQEFREKAAVRLGFEGWSDLPPSWQDSLARTRWERLGSLSVQGGGKAPTIPIETTWKWMPYEDGPAQATPVGPGEMVVYNVRGPVVIEAAWREDDAHTPREEATVLARTDAFGQVESSVLPPTATLGPWSIKEAIGSIAIGRPADATGWAQLVVRELPLQGGGPFGRPARLDDADPPPPPSEGEVPHSGGGGGSLTPSGSAQATWLRVGPELVSREAYRLVAGERLTYRLEPGTVARVMATRPLGQAVETDLIVSIALSGAEPSELVVPPLRDPYARYAEGPNVHAGFPSESVERYVQSTDEAATLSLVTSGPADVAVRVRRIDAIELRLPDPVYRLPDGCGVIARYVPDRGTWERHIADDHEALALQGRVVRVDYQVQLAPWTPPGSDGSIPRWSTLDLGEPFEIVLEPDLDGETSLGARVALSASPRTVDVGDAGRLHVEYHVPPEGLGAPVVLEIDDEQETRAVHATNGSMTLRTGPGTHHVSVTGLGAFYAATQGAAEWQTRRVWRVGPSLRVHVPAGPQKLRVYTYATAGTAPRVYWEVAGLSRASISDLEPLAPEGRIDVLTGRSEAVPWSFVGPTLDAGAPVTLAFGDGPERDVELYFEGDDDLLVRAVASWTLAPTATSALQRVRNP
jgi:hypothetical protein